MTRLKITEFNKGNGKVQIGLNSIYSLEEVIKLGLLGYLDNDSKLRLRQYLILRETKVLGGLVDYELNDYRLRYQGQTVDVKLQIPEGVIDLDLCFMRSDIEKLRLRGKNVVSLYSLVESCKLLKEVFIDIVFSDEVVNLSWCFSETDCLQQVTFSKVANRAKIDAMFKLSDIKEIRLRDYVINVEDPAWNCFYSCKELVSLDCSEVKFNKGIDGVLGYNLKLETISFRNCWFGGRAKLVQSGFLHPVTIDLRGARCKGLEKVKSLSEKRKSNKAVDKFIKQFELDNVTLILD